MRHPTRRRGGLRRPAALAAWLAAASAGCTHNYYYGTPPACPPTATTITPGVVRYGEVCEVPTVVGGGNTVASAPSTVSPGLSGPRPPRVVLSESNDGGFRSAWRRSDPEDSLATTRVDGALNDPTVIK